MEEKRDEEEWKEKLTPQFRLTLLHRPGHVFDDGPQDRGGKRYCINSVCLDFQKE